MKKKIAINIFSLICSVLACVTQFIFMLPIDHSPLMMPMPLFFLGPAIFSSVYINKKQLYFTKEDTKDPRLKLLSNLSTFFFAIFSALFFCLLVVSVFAN